MDRTPTPSLNLLRLLLNKAKILEDSLNDALGKVGLSVPKLTALTYLVQAGAPISLSELTRRMQCVKSNVTQLIDRLEADGLVRRLPDPRDRRSVLAEVTVAGRNLHKAGIQIASEVEQNLFQVLTIEEQKHLVELLTKIGLL